MKTEQEPEPLPAEFENYYDYFQATRRWDRKETLRQAKEHARSAGSFGIGFGSAMAMVLSFELNHSIWWMILHGICSWGYVIYRGWQGNY